MNLRETIINLAVTAVIVLVIVFAAVVLKERRSRVPRAVPLSLAEVNGLDLEARPVRENFEVLTGAVLVETRANEADTLRVRVGETEHVFVLYFVDALEASKTHPQRVSDQARWFGNLSEDLIVDGGMEARNYVMQLLAAKPFQILTRWERVPNSVRYYALIRVEAEAGKTAYLADLLMRQGYARVQGLMTPIPGDVRSEADYVLELKSLGERARVERRGIWRHVE